MGMEDPDFELNYNKDVKDMKMIVYTSGTTGLAKGVMLSEHNLVSMVYNGLLTCTVYSKCLSFANPLYKECFLMYNNLL